MKKLIALTSAFILAAVSCSSKNTEIEPVRNENGKYVVTVGSFGDDPFIMDTARHPDDIEVQHIDLTEGYTIGRYDEQQQKEIHMELDKRVAKGDLPDVLILSPKDVMRLERIGALADLSALMDEYDGIKREELTDAALSGLTIDGHISALMRNYSISVPVAKAKFVPREYTNWDADAAMGFYKKMPEGMLFGCYYDEDGTSAAMEMLELEGLNCVDEKNGICDFSGKFAELLQFCCDNPGEPVPRVNTAGMSEEEREHYYNDLKYTTMRDESLTYVCGWGRGYGSRDPQDIYNEFFGQDITFVGYPSEDGFGAEIDCDNLCCITASCANKAAAWELVCKMIRTNYDTSWSLASRPYSISIFREWINDDYNSYIASLDKDSVGESGVITKEFFDNVMEYCMSTPANVYRNDELNGIIRGECKSALKGERSVEEAIRQHRTIANR